MRPVYATRLTVLPAGDPSGVKLHDRLVELAHVWIVSVAAKYGSQMSGDSTADTEFSHASGGCTGATRHLLVDGARGWRAVVVHPYRSSYDKGDNLELRSEVQIRDDAGEGVVTVRVLLGSRMDRIRPQGYGMRPPKLVHSIIELFPDVFCGNLRMTARADMWPEMEMDHLVGEIVRPDRFAPIVVVSKRPDGTPACNAAAIATAVAGVARVVELSSYTAAYRLTKLLGELSCYNGAVRLYWPGCAATDSPHFHTAWMASELDQGDTAERLPNAIARRIFPVASAAIQSDYQVWEMYRRAEAARTDDLIRRIRQETETSKHLDISAAEVLLNEASEKLEFMESALQTREREIAALEERVWVLSGKEAMLRAGKRTSANGTELLDRWIGSATLRDVVELAEYAYGGDHVEFLPEAYESAAESPYSGNLMTALTMIRAICRVAHRYHEDDIGASFQEAFRSEGENNYSVGVSQTAQTQHREKYIRSYDDGGGARDILLGPHLAFGSGNPRTSLRIYWHVDSMNRRFVIGHVGRHLPGKQDT